MPAAAATNGTGTARGGDDDDKLAPRPDPLSVLEAHPLASELRRAADDVSLERSVLDIPPPDRADNFTTGILSHASCFGAVDPAVLSSRAAGTVLAAFHLGPGFTGHRGFVHGGVISTLMDECCGRAAVCHYEAAQLAYPSNDRPPIRSAAMTAQLAVDFVAPVRTGSYVMVRAVVQQEGTSGRKSRVTAQLWSVGGGRGGGGGQGGGREEDTLCATAKALFIEPKI